MFFRVIVLLAFLILSFVSFVDQPHANVASFQFTWADNSTNEDGFIIERKTGTNGIFARIASVGADVTSYTDAALADATTYCYRVNAFNSAGTSPYSPEICGTTPASPTAAFNLTVSSQGSGTITSAPAGINCRTTCTASFTSGTSVTLQAAAATGYAFAGWSGNSDCLDGRVTVNSSKSCIANFTRTSSQTSRLTVNLVQAVTAVGTGQGSVTSSPAGINCGTACIANFTTGATVTLKATPASGSVFSGWTGDTDCSDGILNMNSSKSCTASFSIKGNKLNINMKGGGKGRVTGSHGSIDCVTDCSVNFPAPTHVSLRAVPAPGSTFVGWSGDPGCSKGAVAISVSTSCIATFEQRPSSIGIFNTTTHEWHLKRSIASANNSCDISPCINAWQKKKIPAFGSQWIPIVGDWNGSGTDDIGIYSAADSAGRGSRWHLDPNGNEKWNGCENDRCIRSFGQEGDLPVAGDWNGGGKDKIGVFRPSTGEWFLDLDGDRRNDNCSIDRCIASFGQQDDLPVIGDWAGTGISNVGVFRPSTGEWLLDRNGNGRWDGCNLDQCISGFGQQGDRPVAGDWNATGSSKIGVFRPHTGEWFLDINGNGHWDEVNVDRYIVNFGQEGDLPVAGKW
jgi:Divergent InlB B-repeat domain